MKRIKNILLALTVILLLVVSVVGCSAAPAGKTYKVSFDTLGMTEIATQNVKENGTATRPTPDPSNEWYTFVDWYTDMSYATKFDFSTPITQDTTVYAKWVEKESTYTITFNSNGYGKAPQKQYIPAGTNGKITKPNDLVIDGLLFVGWSLDKNGLDNLLDFNTYIPYQSVTIYAQWKKIFTVSFDLNNDEAFIPTPDEQRIVSNECAQRPNDEDVDKVAGYEFLGWYSDAQGLVEFDFSQPITKHTTIYAKWEENKVGTIDGSGLPSYEWDGEAAYGESPDPGFKIDGLMGESENWEYQKWYKNATVDAPTVSYEFTTQFSDRGLYFFVSATDRAGVVFLDRGYHFKNTGFDITMITGDLSTGSTYLTRTIQFDTYCVFGDVYNYKLAIKVVEGEVNSTKDDKTATWNAECFITWDELGLSEKPQSMRIYPQYNYKRMPTDTTTLKLGPTFVKNNEMSYYNSFVPFNETGYMLADNVDYLGDSPYGVAKTSGWVVENLTQDDTSYLETSEKAQGSNVIFYKNATGNYYLVKADIEVTDKSIAVGQAGLGVFNSVTRYIYYTVDVDKSVLTADGEFNVIKPSYTLTNASGNAIKTTLDTIELSSPVKTVNLEVIYSNGYVYFIVNGEFVHCQYVSDFNQRTSGAIMTQGAKGVKYTNFVSQVYTTKADADAYTATYANIISTGSAQNLTVSYDTVGQAKIEPKPITMTVQNKSVTLTPANRDKVLAGDMSPVSVYQIKAVKLNGVDYTEQYKAGAGWGQYQFDTLDEDTVVSFETEKVNASDLTYVKVLLKDSITKEYIEANGSVVVKSNDPLLGYYTVNVTNGIVVVPVKKGYSYDLKISLSGYRTLTLSHDAIDELNDVSVPDGEKGVTLDDQILTTMVVGGKAVGKFEVDSAKVYWDYSNEENNEVYFVTYGAKVSIAYFSGATVSKYQVAQVKIANVTDKVDMPNYEKDPAAGFTIYAPGVKRKFIGLHKNGLRMVPERGTWAPEEIHLESLGSTVNRIDTTGNTYTTLTMIKIGMGDYADVYMYINDTYVTKYTFEGIGEETAIGFDVTTSFATKIKFFDYWIKVGDEALDTAKTMFGNSITLGDSCYIDEKPLISVENCVSLNYANGSVGQTALKGTSMTIKLTDDESLLWQNTAYIVTVGNKKVALTPNSPTAEILVEEVGDDISISVDYANSIQVSGKVVIDGGANAGVVLGTMTSTDGILLTFETNPDGTFAFDAVAGKSYTLKFDLDMHASKINTVVVGKNDKDIGTFTLYPVVFGGETSSTKATWGVGYSDEKLTIEGLYTEVNAKSDNTQRYSYSTFDNCVVEFTVVRREVEGIEKNETDSAIGLSVISGDYTEFYGVYRDGGLMLDHEYKWSNMIKFGQGNLPFTIQNNFDTAFDIKIIKYGNTFSIYARLNGESEYIYVGTQTSRFNLAKATIGLRVTSSYPLHHFFYNEKVYAFTDDNLPAEIVKSLDVICNAGGTYTIENAKDSYTLGEVVVFKPSPEQGKVAFIKAYGNFYYPQEDGSILYTVQNNANQIEIFFENYEEIAISGKLVPQGGATLPETFDFAVHMPDGRIYDFTGVAIAQDGTFSFPFRTGSYTIVAKRGTMVAKTVSVIDANSDIDLGSLDLHDIFIGGANESWTSNSNAVYGYGYNDGANVIDGPYVEVSHTNNSLQAMRVGKMGDFEFSFSYIRKEVEGVANEADPGVGLYFSDGTNKEIYIFQDDKACVVQKGNWSSIKKSTETLSSTLKNSKDTAFDFKIKRVGNVFTFYGKLSSETEYETLLEYESTIEFGEIETRFIVSAAAKSVRYILYGLEYKAL